MDNDKHNRILEDGSLVELAAMMLEDETVLSIGIIMPGVKPIFIEREVTHEEE